MSPATTELLAHQFQGVGRETVLLLNGGMMTHAAWAPISQALVNDYRVLGCDFRGQFLSPGEAPTELADHVDDLVALLDHHALRSVHVLGTSFGGEIGLILAALHPERVRSLAVVTAVDRSPPGMLEGSRELAALAREILDGADPLPFHETLAGNVYSPAYQESHAEELAARRAMAAGLPATWYRGILGILKSVESFDLTAYLGQIRSPTLVVHAALDAGMPLERVKAIADAIEGAELRIHPTSGHGLVVEDPAWVARAYLEFLGGLSDG